MRPVVAVVGRPNVGKSTLFNKIVGQRIAIVEDTPGVTRDRLYAEAEWSGRHFVLVDTGGIEPDTTDFLLARMREQAMLAMETADVILFMVDGRSGVTAADREVAAMLMRTGKEVILAANKIDTARLPDDFYDFYEFGLGEPVAVSATNVLGIGDLLDEIMKRLPEENEGEDDEESVKIAVVGKPNVGKSSLINALLGEERVIVSDVPGTTRDSIDTALMTAEGDAYVLIDTAGIRRRSKVLQDIERYSVIRSISAIERSDVCLLLLDADQGVTEQDKKIAGLAHEAGKGIIIVVNKWDLIEKETNTMKQFQEEIRRELAFMTYAPMLFISVLKNQRINKVLELAKHVSCQRSMRVSTGQLNSLIADAVMMNQPPSDKGKRLKIYYATQVGIRPPLFSFKINDRELMHFSYARYLENKIRSGFEFEGTSIKFVFREKGDDSSGA